MSDFAQIRFLPNRPLLRELSADRLNTILQEIKRNKPKGERGITVRQDGTGTYIGLAASLPRGGTSAPATIRPFQLAVVNDSETEEPEWKIRVYPSTLAGGSSTDLGFALADDPPYLLTAEAGIVQGGFTIDLSGAVTSRWLEIVSELSPDSSDEEGQTFYVEIGTVNEDEEENTFTVNNSRYGPINANICRNWFSAEPRFGVTFGSFFV
jgi:hypothetical protein